MSWRPCSSLTTWLSSSRWRRRRSSSVNLPQVFGPSLRGTLPTDLAPWPRRSGATACAPGHRPCCLSPAGPLLSWEDDPVRPPPKEGMLHQPLDLLPAQGPPPAVRHDQRGGVLPRTTRRVGVLLAAVCQQLPVAVEGGGTPARLPERAMPLAFWGVLWPHLHLLLPSSQVGRSCRQHRVWQCQPVSGVGRRSAG